MGARWSPALELGHDVIDRQHQELFRRYESLVQALARGDRAEVGPLFEFLGSYVVEHFADEERLMSETAFPGLTVHKASHDRFVREYHALHELFERAGPTAAIAVRAETWIADWLATHIGATDAHLARHLRGAR
jgi:hemerythrin